MRHEGTLATAIVVVLISRVLSAAAMIGGLSKDKGAGTVVMMDTPFGATGGTQTTAGRLASKTNSAGKRGSAPAAVGATAVAAAPGTGATATADVAVSGAGAAAPGSGDTSGSGSGTSVTAAVSGPAGSTTPSTSGSVPTVPTSGAPTFSPSLLAVPGLGSLLQKSR